MTTDEFATAADARHAGIRDAAQAHVPADPSPDVAVQLKRALDAIAVGAAVMRSASSKASGAGVQHDAGDEAVAE